MTHTIRLIGDDGVAQVATAGEFTNQFCKRFKFYITRNCESIELVFGQQKLTSDIFAKPFGTTLYTCPADTSLPKNQMYQFV